MDLFLCDHFQCRLTEAACLSRREKGTTTADLKHVSSIPFEFCATCAQGLEVQRRIDEAGLLKATRAASEALRKRRMGLLMMRRRSQKTANVAVAEAEVPELLVEQTPELLPEPTREEPRLTVCPAPVVEPEPECAPEPAPLRLTMTHPDRLPRPSGLKAFIAATSPTRWFVRHLSDEQLSELAEAVGLEAERRELSEQRAAA